MKGERNYSCLRNGATDVILKPDPPPLWTSNLVKSTYTKQLEVDHFPWYEAQLILLYQIQMISDLYAHNSTHWLPKIPPEHASNSRYGTS